MRPILPRPTCSPGVVGEFPKLQGVMGSKYAILSGEDPRVAAAIAEHYLPRFAGDALPGSLEGMCVGIADRIDTITGCFSVGLVPSGSEDPYGLRRQSVAILAMLFDRGMHLSLAALVAEACKGHGLKKADQAKVETEILDFLRQRLAGMLTTEGLRSDVVDAALSGTFDDPLVAKEKVRALDAWRTSEDYRPLVTALKRAGNIVPKDFCRRGEERPAEGRGREGAVHRLHGHQGPGEGKDSEARFPRVPLPTSRRCGNPVDAFFDKVMVMDKDAEVKRTAWRCSPASPGSSRGSRISRGWC